MHCPHCDADTPDGARFCIECGTPLTPRCPQCGADMLPRAKFCGACGTPLTAQSPTPPAAPPPSPLRYAPGYLAEKILTSKTALEGERKQVTVLFADLKGSMELLADHDPEEARAILDLVLERMMEAVHRYEGTVNQVMGDGIMALFGAPIAHEDHAVRACYAALAMQEAIRRYSEEVRRTHGVEVQIRVGLHSQALLGEDPHLTPCKQLLIARTEGNPFFLEESVRTLVETQVLVVAPVAYRLAQALPTIQVPATVQAVLAARIDRLTPEDKRLLQTAAVIGHEVPWPLVQAMAEQPEVELHRGLAHLQAAEFLYAMRLFPEREFTFKHALTHEVAYGSLLQERRRTLHARIVEALEGLQADGLAEQVERLAHHAFRGEVWDRALAYCRQAAAKAVVRSAHREAVAYFEQALVALQHLPESREVLEQAIDLRIDLRNALWPLAEHGRSLEYLRDAESVAKVLNDQRRLGWVSAYLAEDFWRTGNPDRAVESGQRALAIAAALGDFGLQVVTNRHLGQAYHTLGDYSQAMDFLRKNLASLKGEPLRERFGSPNILSVISRVYLVWSLAEQGAFAEGVVMGEEAVRIAESANYPISLIAAYCGVGILYLRRGDLHQAIPVLERGLGLCKLWNIVIWFPRTACALGYGDALSGRVPKALPLLEQAVEQATSSRSMVEQSLRVACLGETYLLASRIDEAIQLGHRALELARTHKEGGHEAWTLRLLGQIHAHRDPPNADQANAHYREALVLADELGMRPVIAHCHRGLGKLYAKSGRRAEACAELSTAVDLYRAMEMTFWLPQAEAALAQGEGR